MSSASSSHPTSSSSSFCPSSITSPESLQLFSSLPPSVSHPIISIIGTHDGTFHADEALACFLLRLTKQFSNANIIRTRDTPSLNQCTILVDVGGVFDEKTFRFDHHQKSFTDTFDSNHSIRLSSAGLIYKYFGKEILLTLSENKATTEEINEMYEKLYNDFIEAMDGIDNGVLQYPISVKPAYKINTDLGSRIKNLNPMWNEENESRDTINERFRKAMKLAGEEFIDAFRFIWKAYLPARSIVKAAIDNRFTIDSSGEIVYFPQCTNWKSHLLELETKLNITIPIKYVIFSDTNGAFRIQAVPVEESSFLNRAPLPQLWCGLRDDELSKISGIDGCIFVHATGFIGGNKTFEGVIQMAKKALAIIKENEHKNGKRPRED